MRYDIIFTPEKNRFTLKTYEYLTMTGIQEMIRELVTHKDWKKGRDLFIDHREASFEKISIEDIISLSNTVMLLDETLGAHRCSVISSDDGYLKNAMYQNKIDSNAKIVTRTFLPTEYDQAIAWLDSGL